MKKALISLLVLVNSFTFAGTVEWGVVNALVFQNHVGHLFYLMQIEAIGAFVMSGEIVTENEGSITFLSTSSQWFEMQYGDWVNAETTKPNSDDYFFSVTIKNGESVYLGFVLPDDIYDGLVVVPCYGWVQLGYNGSSAFVVYRDISTLNSAIDISGDPIRIWIIPEPSTALLTLSGVALLLRRRTRPNVAQVSRLAAGQ